MAALLERPRPSLARQHDFDILAGRRHRLDCADRGNIATRLVYCPAESSARERFAVSIAKIVAMVPEAEVAVLSAGEIAFRLRGLEFARARLAARAASFRHSEEIIFGAGQMSACLASTMPMHS